MAWRYLTVPLLLLGDAAAADEGTCEKCDEAPGDATTLLALRTKLHTPLAARSTLPCLANDTDATQNNCGNPTFGCYYAPECMSGELTQCNAGGSGALCRYCYKPGQTEGLPGGSPCPTGLGLAHEVPCLVNLEDSSRNDCGDPAFGCYYEPACMPLTTLGDCNAGGSGQLCRYCYKAGGQASGLEGGVPCPGPTSLAARGSQRRRAEDLPCLADETDATQNVCGNPTFGCYYEPKCGPGTTLAQCNAGGVGQYCRFCYKPGQTEGLPGGEPCPVSEPAPVLACLVNTTDATQNVCGNPTFGCYYEPACAPGTALTQCNAGGAGQLCRFCYKPGQSEGLPGAGPCPLTGEVLPEGAPLPETTTPLPELPEGEP